MADGPAGAATVSLLAGHLDVAVKQFKLFLQTESAWGKTMGNRRLVGLVLLVIGAFLLYFGWQSSESIADQFAQALTGRFTEETLWLMIGGGATAAAGLFLALTRG